MNLNLPAGKLIDISLPLDARTFHMRTYSGFKKDMQFEVEVIKEYEDERRWVLLFYFEPS